MEKHHSCINTLSVIEYFQEHAPGLVDELLQQLGPEVDDLPDVKGFLMDPNNWVSGYVLINMYRNAKRLLGDDVIFKIGYDSVIKKRLGYIQRILLCALRGPEQAIKRIQTLNDKFNRNKAIHTVDLNNKGAILQLHWFRNVPLSEDFCSVNKGIYTAVPVFWGLPPAHLEETRCFFKGNECCEYHLTWKRESPLKEYFLKVFLPWKVIENSVKVVENSIREVERDKELIKKKYDEVHRLNIQLKNKIDQLLSLQEVSTAILSTLETERLFDLILRLLVKVARLDRAAIFIVDEEKQALSLVHAVGVSPEDFSEIKDYTVSLSKIDNIIARTAARNEPVFVEDVAGSALNKDNPLIRKFRPKAFILVPLAAQGKILGVLVGDQVQDSLNVAFPDKEFLTSFANQIAMALNNSNLYRKLAESERRYRQLIENAHDGIWVLDDKDNLILANRRMSEIFTNGHLIGQNIHRYVDGENERILKRLLDQNRAGLVAQGMMELKGKDGGQISAIISSVPLMEEGLCKGSFAIVTDISHIKRLERQLYQAQKMESVGTMAGGIAHDFNNILTSILGYTALLKQQVQDMDAQKHLDVIEKSSLRAADLVKKMLTFSRGGQIQNLAPVDVNEIILETVRLLENVIDKRVEIQLGLDASPATILGDATQLQQAMLNICLNARDVMPDGGVLGIKTEICTISNGYDTHYLSVARGKYVKISISDTGPGIHEKDLGKIFDPFFTTKPLGKGTGLGLAVVHGIVTGLKGRIYVDSKIGKGSIFELFFPEADIEAVEQATTEHTVKVEGRETILLVDDEQYNRELGEKVLTFHGYNVLLAKDGLEAVDIYKSAKDAIALVILDFMMPNLSGLDTYKRLKEIDPAVKVIICTGYGLDHEAMQELQGGICGFIQKPYNLEKLAQAVRKGIDSGFVLPN
ncbi:MAG: response regulator [Desulfovibrionales bacterium]|nr:response regulator [Desulfovibrionales bacterium]